MQEKFPQRKNEEELREENSFLKMKLMLEHGATLNEKGDEAIPVEIENVFLQNVMAFEKQYQEKKQIKIIDKIGNPQHFKPVTEIPGNAIDEAWQELLNHLNEHCLDITACSPNVTNRELYRFTTEELFQVETDDISLPGWMTHFIYDEFYPDPIYDNTQIAVRYFFENIFRKDPVDWDQFLALEGIRLNEHVNLNREAFSIILDRFRNSFDEIRFKAGYNNEGELKEEKCLIRGNYKATAKNGSDLVKYSGRWRLIFEREPNYGHWVITTIEIEGINF